MPTPPKTPALSQHELAALDFMIMHAIRRGAKPTDVLTFIDNISNVVISAASHVDHAVSQGTDAVTNTSQNAYHHVVDWVHGWWGHNELPEDAMEAVKQGALTAASAPTLTLQQLIDVRRRAVEK